MPPTGLILTIDGAATYTRDLLVDLGISAVGATEMRFSNAAPNYSAWEPYNTDKLSWDLRGWGGNDFEGIKTVWVEVIELIRGRRPAISVKGSIRAASGFHRGKAARRKREGFPLRDYIIGPKKPQRYLEITGNHGRVVVNYPSRARK